MRTSTRREAGGVACPPAEITSGRDSLSVERCRDLHRVMITARLVEERCIKMSKSGEAYFWVGGPGEEAFNACLGMQVRRGEGPTFDYLHLHYRNLAVLLGMGMAPIDHLRQMAMTLTDPHSMGRNFVCHYSRKDWNVIPVTSVIEVQYVMALGTAHVQRRHGGEGVTVVVGGDAGTAEGDFASCLIWSSRPGNELPILIVVTNNGYGISTKADSVHAEKRIIDRGQAFGIPGEVVDGNDPIASWHAIRRGLRYCRGERRPYLLEARVSRLHGHSSSSGAARVRDEVDGVDCFERRLVEEGVYKPDELRAIHAEIKDEIEEAVRQVHAEPRPTAADVFRHTYAPSPVDVVYPEDYTGLPN